MNRRQKSYAVVDRIGDILLEIVPDFAPFVSYGAHQLYGKYEFEKEKTSNPAFADFVEVGFSLSYHLLITSNHSIQVAERLPESRKLELNAYLTKPTTRLARYPLLLEAVLKHTPSDSSDKTILPRVISLVREFLAKVNTESGKTENRFNLLQLDQHIVFKPGEEVVCIIVLWFFLCVRGLHTCFLEPAAHGGRTGDGVQRNSEQAGWRGSGVSFRSCTLICEVCEDEKYRAVQSL